jgi:hypothetical protein
MHIEENEFAAPGIARKRDVLKGDSKLDPGPTIELTNAMSIRLI